jgi:hypothetical protein
MFNLERDFAARAQRRHRIARHATSPTSLFHYRLRSFRITRIIYKGIFS